MNSGEDHLVLQLLLQAILIGVNAVFACAEIAFISTNSVKLEKLAESGNRRAKRLLGLTSKPAKFLATIQVGITLAGFLGSAFAADNFAGKLTAALVNAGLKIPAATIGTISLVLITIVLSFFTLVFGELVPKRIAMNKAESLAFALSSLILFISKIFAPIVWLLTKTTNGILRLVGIDPNAQEDEVTEEEIRLLVDAGSEKGAIAEGEKEIIDNVFEFDDKTAEEVMTHRRDTIILWLEDDDAAWDKIIRETDHSRYPVCGANEDDVRGVLDARNYFELFTAGIDDIRRDEVMAKAVEPPQLVPATIPTNVLFRKMKKRRNHFAVVIDEYGGMDGVVTMNDLLEELVGDIAENEAAAEAPAIITRAPGVWQISGGAPLDKVARETGAPLPAADYDTFGGYVFTLLGRIPDDGETFDLEAEGLRISVVSVKDHRLERALVRRHDRARKAG